MKKIYSVTLFLVADLLFFTYNSFALSEEDREWIRAEIKSYQDDITPSVAIGTVIPFAGDMTPTGYIRCDGSWLSIENERNLFAVIAHTFSTEQEQAQNPGRFKLPK